MVVTGEHLTGATDVTFGGVSGTGLSEISDTELWVVTPAGSAGPVDVVVTTPYGSSNAGAFTYVAAPVVTLVNPDSGPEAGGTLVTITGESFSYVNSVTFDGVAGAGWYLISDTSLQVDAPAGTGTVDVVVTTVGGVSNAGSFTYVPPVPVVSLVAPTSGPIAGGTTVTITGEHLTGVTSVTFGGLAGTGLSVASDTSLSVTTPAHAAGPVDVVVTSPDGSSDPGSFTYVAPPPVPVVSLVAPTSGPIAGGTTVTITGLHLTGVTSVTFGGLAGTGLSVASDTSLSVTTPAHAAGPVDVVVTSPDGSSGAAAFTFTAPVLPTVTATVDSATIPQGGTAGVTVAVSPVPTSGTVVVQYLLGSTWTTFTPALSLSAGSVHTTWVPLGSYQYRVKYGTVLQ